MIAATVAFAGGIAVLRARMTAYLDRYGWPHPRTRDWMWGFTPHAHWLKQGGYAIALTPVLLGAVLGAPLLAGDLQSGTAKLVASQSASRLRWLAAKLGISLGMVAVCTAALSIAFGWWWGPVRATPVVFWTDEAIFDSTGPAPTALALFTVAAGIAIGLLLRRALLATAVAFGFAVAVQPLWARFVFGLGHPDHRRRCHLACTPFNGTFGNALSVTVGVHGTPPSFPPRKRSRPCGDSSCAPPSGWGGRASPGEQNGRRARRRGRSVRSSRPRFH